MREAFACTAGPVTAGPIAECVGSFGEQRKKKDDVLPFGEVLSGRLPT